MTTDQHIHQIAREYLDIETLQTRNSDRLDFHEVAVWQIADALRAAYEAGQANPPRRASNKTTPRPRP